MASKGISLGVVIGGSVDQSFGKSLSSAGKQVGGFAKRAESARGFQKLIGDTVKLREEMQKTGNKSGDAFGKMLKQHDANISKLRQHGIAVERLDREYVRLGRTSKGMALIASGRESIGKGLQQGKQAVQVGASVAAAAAIPTMVAANYQAIIRDIAIKGGVARTGDEQELSDSVRRDATAAGMERNELAEAVNTLVSGGVEVKEAAGMAALLARFSVGQGAESTDVARMVLALRQAGISDPKAIEQALGKIAVAGDLGSFEASDMAKHFASLMPQLTAFGMAGEQASVMLAGMLQTQMLAAGSADEAATNLANLLSKLTSDDSVKKFEKQGINLAGSMQAAITKGYDPITAFLGIVEQSTKRADPKKAAEMAALQTKIAGSQDPAATQKMLDGYLEMAGLSQFISDRQARQAALAALQNSKLHAQNMQTIQSTDGVAKIEKDLADRRDASKARWSEAANAMNESMAKLGEAIRPLTDRVADGVTYLATAVGEFSAKFPDVASGLLLIGGAVATFKAAQAGISITKGVANIARGGIMAGSGGKIPGLGGFAGGLGGGAGAGAGLPGGLGGTVGPQPVFVTNWPAGGMGNGGGGRGGRGGRGKGAGGAGKAAGGAGKAAAGVGKAAGGVGKAADLLGKVGGTAGGALAIGTAAYQVYDTAANAETQDEKAEGYGGAAGALAGGLAGAKMGALAGSLVGPVGTVVGGVAGGAIGSLGGSELGGWLSKKMFGSDEESPKPEPVKAIGDSGDIAAKLIAATPVPSPPAAPVDNAATTAAPVASVSQQLTFSPSIQVTVQGDVKDPRQIATELMPHLKRLFEDWGRQQSRAGLYDAPQL